MRADIRLITMDMSPTTRPASKEWKNKLHGEIQMGKGLILFSSRPKSALSYSFYSFMITPPHFS